MVDDQIQKNGSETESQNQASGRGPVARFFYWSMVGSVWMIIGLLVFAVFLVRDLPDLGTLPPPGQQDRVEIRAENGALLASYGALYGQWLEYDEIPPIMIKAIVSIEDRRFFRHGGIDIWGIARAVVINLRSGSVRQGASTLTQQLAKNLFLSRERTLKRKLQEFLLSLWLEETFDKETILAIYLNRVYFGSGTYGIDAASLKYFGHSARTLNLAEAALLAGLVKAPSRYAPTRNIDLAHQRAVVVLGAMQENDDITMEAKEKAVAQPARLSSKYLGGDIRYYTDWVMARLGKFVKRGHQPLIVFTSLDLNAQMAAKTSIERSFLVGPEDVKSGQVALVSMASDGALKAMVGGRSYAESQFNRATSALRQPGSAFKTFVYLAAMEDGHRPDDFLVDEPITVDGWTPQNFSGRYLGRKSLRDGFALSLNTMAVQLSELVGREKVKDIAIRLGITSNIRAHPSLALGTSEVTPIDMATAYAVIANGGFVVEPYAILEIRSGEGDLLYRRQPAENVRILSEVVVLRMLDLMEAVFEYGTGRRAKIDRPSAGKTGTSQDYRDAWFIGFTSDLVTSVWIGNDDGSPTASITGGGLPADIWSDYMLEAHVGKPVRNLIIGDLADRP